MLLGKPFAELNELAALRTERPELSVEPRADLAARRAFDLRRPAHVQLRLTPHFCANSFQVSGDADRRGARDRADLQDGLSVFDGLVERGGGKTAAVHHGVNISREA